MKLANKHWLLAPSSKVKPEETIEKKEKRIWEIEETKKERWGPCGRVCGWAGAPRADCRRQQRGGLEKTSCNALASPWGARSSYCFPAPGQRLCPKGQTTAVHRRKALGWVATIPGTYSFNLSLQAIREHGVKAGRPPPHNASRCIHCLWSGHR